ncbi:MAG: HD domain-containing protein [Lachnospiraceae bacterium]|nr:HD domain-containing protein [Lachnospiraceae bacterium]
MLCLFFGPISARADDSSENKNVIYIDPEGNSGGYTTVLYDNSNGLPTSEANAIAETSDGFIWIGCYSGLVRYDGNTFERYDSTSGIASVMSLYVDTKDRLWIGTNDSGIAVIEDDDLRIFNKDDGLKSLSVRDIKEDENGYIYVATTEGLCIIDPDFNVLSFDDPTLEHTYIKQLEMDDTGLIYGVTNDGSVFLIRDEELIGLYTEEYLGVDGIHTILADPYNEGYFYIGTEGSGVYSGKLTAGYRKTGLIDVSPLEYINDIFPINDQIFIVADNGIGVIENNRFTQIKNVALNSSIEKMITDYQGNLWFTSSKQGVMKIVPSMFFDVFENYELDECVVNTTCYYEDKLFIGTKDDGIIVLDEEGRVENIPLNSVVTALKGEVIEADDLIAMLDGQKIRSIEGDSKGNLWIATFGKYGLVRYKDGEATCFTVNDGIPTERVRAIYEKADGTYLVACTGGVALIDGNDVKKVYDESDGITNSEVLTVCGAENGEDIIVGTDGGGIYIVNEESTRHIGIEEGLQSEVVMRIKKDRTENVYWVITSNSIACMDADYNVSTIKNFPYSNNFDWYEDSNGRMWILSSNGIYVVTVEEMLANGEINLLYFSKENGLCCYSTSNSYSGITDAGDLYIAGTTGVARINIDKPFEGTDELKMNIPYLEANGEKVYPDENGNYTLQSDAKKVTIYTFVYNYSLVNPKVTYYLDGFDDEKVTVDRTELVPVDYTNLKGGEYDFVVSLTDPSGAEVNSEAIVHIKKIKAFYETVWFYLVMVGSILFILWAAVKLYVRKKTKDFERKERENNKLMDEITEAFAKMIDLKDAYTNGHSTRVGEYTKMLATELGYDEATVNKYYRIALLHDVGKIGVPSAVLNKNGKLTDEEFAKIKSHTIRGEEALKNISIMPEIAIGAGAHHERPDGKGYPRGLKGDEIPRVAQIIGVADTFDAMYSNRPYRNRMNFEKVVSIIKEVSGTQLQPDVVDAFLRLVEKGEFRDPDDHGGGSMEDITNIHKEQDKKEAEEAKENKEE